MALPYVTFGVVPDILTDSLTFAIEATLLQRAVGPPGFVETVKLTVKKCCTLCKRARNTPRLLETAWNAIQHLKAIGRRTGRVEQRPDFTIRQDCAF